MTPLKYAWPVFFRVYRWKKYSRAYCKVIARLGHPNTMWMGEGKWSIPPGRHHAASGNRINKIDLLLLYEWMFRGMRLSQGFIWVLSNMQFLPRNILYTRRSTSNGEKVNKKWCTRICGNTYLRITAVVKSCKKFNFFNKHSIILELQKKSALSPKDHIMVKYVIWKNISNILGNWFLKGGFLF